MTSVGHAIQFESGEQVMFEVRKHWFILMAHMFWGFVAILLPALVYAIASELPIIISAPGNTLILFFFFYALWLIGVLVFLTYIWTDYYLDVWIITNRRIIDIDQQGFFSRENATMQLSKIQDITTSVDGFFPTLIGYGMVRVQTAGYDREFIMHGVKNPNHTRDMIESAVSQYGAIAIK
jgi:uncharacterized membrane protein YdbT with pleckstrin-like domain